MKSNILLPLAIICFAALGCAKIKEIANSAEGPSGTNSNSGASNTAAPSTGATTASSDPKQDIIDASKRFIALRSFSAKMESTGKDVLHSQIDYVAPDRYHIHYTSGLGAGMEMIVIGNQMYMKTGGKWIKSPGSGSSIPNLRDSFTEEGLKTLNDVKFDGDDTVDGKAALVYSYKNVTPKGDYPFTSKIWISKDTGLPMKIEVNYENGILKQMNVVYDTETPVTIEPPIN